MEQSFSSRAKRWVKVAGLAAAGALSFALAASLGTPRMDDDSDLVEVRERPREPAAAPVAERSAAHPSDETPVRIVARSSLSDGQVNQNPFDKLNLQAGREDAPKEAAPPPKPQVTKMAKPAAPQTPAQEVAPAPPPPPTAPPLPFTVVGGISGKKIAGGQPVVFLRLREDVLTVRAGDEIEQLYRVESISADAIELTYLPLKQRQSLSLRP